MSHSQSIKYYTYTSGVDHGQELGLNLVLEVVRVEVDARLVRQEDGVLALDHRGRDQKENHADQRGACAAIATS